jgi:hypothetical protein
LIAAFASRVPTIAVYTPQGLFESPDTLLRLAIPRADEDVFNIEIRERLPIRVESIYPQPGTACLAINMVMHVHPVLWHTIRESSAAMVCLTLEFADLNRLLWELTRIVADMVSLRALHVSVNTVHICRIQGADAYAMRRFLLAVAASPTLQRVSLTPLFINKRYDSYLTYVSGATCGFRLHERQYMSTRDREEIITTEGIRVTVTAPGMKPGQILKVLMGAADDEECDATRYWSMEFGARIAARIVLRRGTYKGPCPAGLAKASELIIVLPDKPGDDDAAVFSEETMMRLVAMAPLAESFTFMGEHPVHSLPPRAGKA